MKEKIYHVVNGRVYACHESLTLKEYKETVKRAYGSLHGVKFVMAKDRNQALDRAANNKTV
jgi:hypothetical protein